MMAASSMQMALGMTTRSLWESTDQKGTDQEKLFAVAAATPEHVKVAIDFAKTLPARTIDRIDRVENGYQHEQFSVKVSSIANTIGAAYDEQTMLRYLFHGTREVGTTRINSILNNPTAGFRPLMSGSTTGAIWGDGAYFARDAKYSHDYAATLPTGQKQMFVVQVATGRWTQGQPGMKMPPLIPGEQYIRFDSRVDDVGNPTIFVVQEGSQAYPAYLITYH